MYPWSFWRALARTGAVAIALVPLTSTVSRADQDAAHRSPRERGTLGLEFAAGPYVEAWNLNERRETLVDGRASVWWSVLDDLMLLIEFHALRVFQEPDRAATVNGFTPVVRWHLAGIPHRPRASAPPEWSLFAELGPGLSWSDTPVPPRGTKFNYLLLAGSGVTVRLGHQTHLVTGFRWLHISNNGREGRARNPDIQALGGYAGVSVSF